MQDSYHRNAERMRCSGIIIYLAIMLCKLYLDMQMIGQVLNISEPRITIGSRNVSRCLHFRVRLQFAAGFRRLQSGTPRIYYEV